MDPVGMDDDQLSVLRRESQGPVFRSIEAQEAYERARRLRRVLRTVVVVCAVAMMGGGMFWLGRLSGGAAPDSAGEEALAAAAECPIAAFDPIGSPDAGVKVVCFFPPKEECHDPIIAMLTTAARTRPTRIRLEVRPLSEYQAEELIDPTSSDCATVLINGQSTFELQLAKGVRKVKLVGTVPMHYLLHQLGEALQQVYTTVYDDDDGPVYELPPDEIVDDGVTKGVPSAQQEAPQRPDFDLPRMHELKLGE